MADKIMHTNHKRRQHMTKYWSDSLRLQWSRQAVIMVSHSTWKTTKIDGVATDLFCTGVIGHSEYNFLNYGYGDPNLRQIDWSTIMI